MKLVYPTVVRTLAFLSAVAVALPRPGRAIEHRIQEKQVSAIRAASNRVLEIRCYNLKPGTRDRFHKLFVQTSLPMLRRFKVDVVAYGPSLHDSDSYFLMRSYPSLEDRQRSEDAFYGSDDWRKGPRDAVMADIENYTTVLIEVDDATIQSLRRTGSQ